MDIEKILTRSEIPDEYKWAVEDIYASDEIFLEELDRFRKSIEEIGRFKENGLSDAASLLEYYKFTNALIPFMTKLYNYAMLNSDSDTSDTHYRDFKDRVMSAYINYNSATSFVMPRLMELSEAELEQFYRDEPELLFFKGDIDDNRRLKEHILDEKGEMMMAMAGEMMDTPDNIYSLLSDSDLRFDKVSYGGRDYELTQSSYITLIEKPERELRKLAFKTLYKTYAQFKNTYAALLSSQIKALAFNSRLRNYGSSLEASLDSANVDTAVYYNLIDTVHANMHYMHEYVSLRKRLLGVEELHMYDIYAPLVEEANRKITFEEAKANVLGAMSVFGDEYLSVLKSGFENRWIDIYENKGKRSGAYSCGDFTHPFVLLNHKDSLDSEFTLAHEMGHAMHSYMSNKHQEPIYAEYKLFVAEVASTCNEALLMQYLLKKTTDKGERAALINYFLEQFKGTLYRQAMFAEYEMKINELYAKGESLTADTLSSLYRSINEEYFGTDMVLDDEIELEWIRIPHFYYNFYVYQYATGFSAAIALSTRILNEGKPAVERYLNFLGAGCTKDPVSLLRDAGVDMASPEPVQTALELFGSLIKEMEELTA
ncbi:MAG: oligoendopeptidase F [Butyrivibrio sp.]|nr:oligoendopeptidase F [Butyrivibrio sp.]